MIWLILEDMMLHLLWNKSAVKQCVMGWPTNSWVMKTSMNGYESTRKISMMILFLTKNFCMKSIWCCQAFASVRLFYSWHHWHFADRYYQHPIISHQNFFSVTNTKYNHVCVSHNILFQRMWWIAVVAIVEIFLTQNMSFASMKNFNVCMDIQIRSIVKTFQTSDQINAMSAKQCWLIAFAIAMLMTLNVPRLAIAILLIAKVTVNNRNIL